MTMTCSGCANLPVEIGEYQAGGPVPTHSYYSKLYPAVPFLAASVIEAVESNVSMFTVYDSSWMINGTTDQILPEGMLYQRLLDNMTMGTDFPVNVSATGIGGVYGLLIQNGTRESLLIVNTNATLGLHIAIATSQFPVGGTGSEWTWAPSATAPTPLGSLTLPKSYTIPAQGLLLLDNY